MRGVRIAVVVLAALVVGAPGVPAATGDRVPAEQTFYLRMLGDSYQDACSRLALSPNDGPDGAECGFTLLKILPPCPAVPACESPDPPRVWRSGRFGEPLMLDASRPVRGVIALSSWQTGICTRASCTMGPPVGVGRYTLSVSLSVTVGGIAKPAGSIDLAYDALPGSDTVFTYEIDIPGGLDGARVEALSLAVGLRGQGAMHGTFEIRRNNPRLELPTFVCEDCD